MKFGEIGQSFYVTELLLSLYFAGVVMWTGGVWTGADVSWRRQRAQEQHWPHCLPGSGSCRLPQSGRCHSEVQA